MGLLLKGKLAKSYINRFIKAYLDINWLDILENLLVICYGDTDELFCGEKMYVGNIFVQGVTNYLGSFMALNCDFQN